MNFSNSGWHNVAYIYGCVLIIGLSLNEGQTMVCMYCLTRATLGISFGYWWSPYYNSKAKIRQDNQKIKKFTKNKRKKYREEVYKFQNLRLVVLTLYFFWLLYYPAWLHEKEKCRQNMFKLLSRWEIK